MKFVIIVLLLFSFSAYAEYVTRDKDGNVVAVYTHPNPSAQEKLPSNHPDIRAMEQRQSNEKAVQVLRKRALEAWKEDQLMKCTLPECVSYQQVK